MDPEGLKWVKTGPNWYDWTFQYDSGELESVQNKINNSGIAGASELEPLDWLFNFNLYKKEKEEKEKLHCN